MYDSIVLGVITLILCPILLQSSWTALSRPAVCFVADQPNMPPPGRARASSPCPGSIQPNRYGRSSILRKSKKFCMLNKYIILDVLGAGTFGKVHCALDVHTLKPFAVKVIRKEIARQQILSNQVRKEVAIMQSLQHPNVVKLVAVFSTKTNIYILMNLVTGGELFREVKRLGRMSEAYARFFFQQLVRGLDYCHSRGVFHRDLKPENLLLDTDNTLKITDFGLSTLLAMPGKRLEKEKLLQTQCGTPHYVAPEILTMPAEGYDGGKTDVWSCGVILYVLVGGGLPFDDHTAERPDEEDMNVIFRKIIRCDIQYPRHFSDELVDLLEHIFTEDPKDRFDLKDIARHAWFLGPISTEEGQKAPPSKPDISEILEKNIQEVLDHYDSIKALLPEHLTSSRGPEKHSIKIVRGADGLPVVAVPPSSGYPARNASTDSVGLSAYQSNTNIGLPEQSLEFDHLRNLPRKNSVSVSNFGHIDGKPLPEQVARLIAESRIGSQGSYSSEDEHPSDLENALEIGGERGNDRHAKVDHVAHETDKSVTVKKLRRNMSTGDLQSLTGRATKRSFGRGDNNPNLNHAAMTERFRKDLWDVAGDKISKAFASGSGRGFQRKKWVPVENPRDLDRRRSFGGPFGVPSFIKPRYPSMHSHLLRKRSSYRNSSPHAPRRSRRGTANSPSLLATTPVVFGPGSKEAPLAQSRTGRRNVTNAGAGHEWNPYEQPDNLVWCKMMRDYDMIPDYEEFGLDSSELNEKWKAELEREHVLRVKSVPRHGSTKFHLSRSSMEMSSPEWREKSRKWMKTVSESPSFDTFPTESFDTEVPTGTPSRTQDRDGNFLTDSSLPSTTLREFVERKGLNLISTVESEKSASLSFEARRSNAYLKAILERSGIEQGAENTLTSGDEAWTTTCEEHFPALGEASASYVRGSESPVTPRLADELDSSSSTTSGYRYSELTCRYSQEESNLPVRLSQGSTPAGNRGGHFVNDPRLIATGPLRKGYGSDNSHDSNKSSGNGREPAELDAKNLFRIAIPGPDVRPPLPEPRPLSKVLKPTSRAVKRLVPRMPSLAINRVWSFNSLVAVDECQFIITQMLETFGCEMLAPKKKGDKWRTRVEVKKPNMNLKAVIIVLAVDSTLTRVSFERKSGDQMVFQEFFDKIRQMHAAHCAAENEPPDLESVQKSPQTVQS